MLHSVSYDMYYQITCKLTLTLHHCLIVKFENEHVYKPAELAPSHTQNNNADLLETTEHNTWPQNELPIQDNSTME